MNLVQRSNCAVVKHTKIPVEIGIFTDI